MRNIKKPLLLYDNQKLTNLKKSLNWTLVIFSNNTMQPELTRLLAIVVVYECDLDAVKSWPFLQQMLTISPVSATPNIENESCLFLNHVIIYDNSPKPRARPSEQLSNCIYIHDFDNGGTAAAYTRACSIAREAGIDWILLLDQDTLLPSGFIKAASAALTRCHLRPSALVPWVFHGSKVVSPARITKGGTIVPLRHKAQPPVFHDLTAISSGSIVHVPTLDSIMPIPRQLWLDYVDHWIYLQLRTSDSSIVVFDASLQHDLSVCTVESLGPTRLTSILDGEITFLAMLGTKARLIYPFRLAGRILRYARNRPDLAMHTLTWMAHRIRRRM
jgi:hypothetical protein